MESLSDRFICLVHFGLRPVLLLGFVGIGGIGAKGWVRFCHPQALSVGYVVTRWHHRNDNIQKYMNLMLFYHLSTFFS